MEETIMDDGGKAYWSATLRLLGWIMAAWFAITFLGGIIFAPQLNSFHLGGYPLGFWIAQQGAMYSYIAMIFIYAKLMGNIDRRFDVHEE
jgi:putative solute:sodium symporter small subunit